MNNKTDEIHQPFGKTIEHLMALKNIDFPTAMADTQSRYDKHTDTNIQLMSEHARQANSAQAQLTSHFALLATLSLTVVGFLFQAVEGLTDPQKFLVLIVLVSQVISLFFGAAEYFVTIFFFRTWSKAYQRVNEEFTAAVDSGKVQFFSDLEKVENDIVSKQRTSTPIWLTYAMVISCLFGLLALIALFSAFLFDVPYYTNSD